MKSRRCQKSATAWLSCEGRELDSAGQPIFPSTLFPRHNEREVSVCYARKHLLPNGPIDLGLQDLRFADITQPHGPPFKQAALSFAMVYFGTQYKQASITNEGYAIYGEALKQLNHALSDPRCYVQDDISLSVVTLALLECLVPTGPSNYLKHMLGLERLLELRDPTSLMECSPRSSQLYKGIRTMILFASLRTRRPSILARSEWKDMLRKMCSHEELQEQDLYDALADCTVLLAEQDKWVDGRDLRAKELSCRQHNPHREALALLANLRRWKARWDSSVQDAPTSGQSNPASWRPSRRYNAKGNSLLASTDVELTMKSSARMLMLYNATLIYVLQVLASKSLDCRGDHAIRNFSYESEDQDDIVWTSISDGRFDLAERLAALEIGHCIPRYLNQKHLQSSSQFSSPVVQWAVTTAWMALGENRSTEGKWVAKMLNGRDNQAIAEGLWER